MTSHENLHGRNTTRFTGRVSPPQGITDHQWRMLRLLSLHRLETSWYFYTESLCRKTNQLPNFSLLHWRVRLNRFERKFLWVNGKNFWLPGIQYRAGYRTNFLSTEDKTRTICELQKKTNFKVVLCLFWPRIINSLKVSMTICVEIDPYFRTLHPLSKPL